MLKKHLFHGAAALAGLLMASGAMAQQAVTVNFTVFDTSETTTISTPAPGFNGDAYATPLEATITSGSSPQTLTVFCVDVYNEIDPPVTGLAYTIVPLATDTFGTGGSTLSYTQVQEIGELATYGSDLISDGSPNLDAAEAGVQDAIWEIEYPGEGYAFTANNPHNDGPDAATYAAQDIAFVDDNPLSTDTYYAIVPDGGDTQAFVCSGCVLDSGGLGGGAGVPEPATWALMIIGAGLVGGSVRARRRTQIV